uniref:Structural maintenance of chromosomes protein 1B-like n=1 Tax=Seriola lalandi dorsalis TaxID=1841481 RepID=A0A3B4WTE0_SERLL
MGYLKQIDIENFKSWRGNQVIGPFMQFNCIIGTNGSGKSNVMDALSFAMGERAASLRVKHLRDLVHGAHVGKPVSDTARVAMRYCDDEDQETVFCRTITGDSSEYRINGVHVTLAKYVEELEKIGIVTKARNCLVFQVKSLKDPKERTKMFELISQSKEYAAEYDRKKEALLKAKEDTQFHFSKKKSATVERKQVSQEKIEAQRYQALVDELHHNCFQLSLAELYHNEKGVNALSNNLREKQQAAAAKNSKLLNWEQTVKTNKKEHGHLTREQQHIEKEIRSQEHILSQTRSQYIKAKINTSHHRKKAEEVRNALKKSQKLFAIKNQELAEGQQEIAELERTWRNYEKQQQQQAASRGRDIELEEDQLERYKELKELARKQGAVLSQQAEKLHWEVRADYEKLAFDQRRKKEVEVGIRNTQSQLEDLTRRAEKLEEYTKTCTSSLEEYRQQEQSLNAELQRGRQRSEEVNQELSQVLEELGSARVDSQESRRQLQRKELLENFFTFPFQYGRLSDLCSPIHKKYQLAVTKVFGRYMNAIVVATEKVARECICFMKQERVEPETFLPVDFLDVSPLNERLRQVPGAKMVVDVVQGNTATGATQLRRVIQFVCGNALVCETIKEARSVAFDRQERLKTVSLDGTLFAKSGVISGGSSDLRNKARCWDEKDMTRLRERKEQLTAELRDLMRLKRKESDLKQIVAQAQGAQTRLKYSKTELENLRKTTILKCQADISRIESELANLDSQIQMQELVKLQLEVMTAETALEQKRLAKHNLLLACKIQGLPITLLSGTLSSTEYFFTQSLQGEEEVEAYLEKLKESVSSTEEVLHLTEFPPSHSAFDASTKLARKCSQEFEQVKARRFHLFSQCFEHVSVVIDQIYKRICRNSSAQAILSADNTDEPYLGGINYNCVAPGKRYMSMDNLSGGEKAIAALALVFAIHSFRPAPFFILDEVDAALDNTNISKVTSFIREESRGNMQIIVISLKEEFFSKADALLGVYSDFDEHMFSRILTLDLRLYPLAEEDGEDEKQTHTEKRVDKRQDSCKKT